MSEVTFCVVVVVVVLPLEVLCEIVVSSEPAVISVSVGEAEVVVVVVVVVLLSELLCDEAESTSDELPSLQAVSPDSVITAHKHISAISFFRFIVSPLGVTGKRPKTKAYIIIIAHFSPCVNRLYGYNSFILITI